ncbi:MAG: hypothetical protein RSB23_03310 [Alistipes sp.]
MKTSFNELKARNILSKEQMQNVKGGGTCAFYLPMSLSNTHFRGDIHATGGFSSGENDSVYKGVSKEEALRETAGISGARWCCDSCDKASWL